MRKKSSLVYDAKGFKRNNRLYLQTCSYFCIRNNDADDARDDADDDTAADYSFITSL
jgi:hypothetical protein